ncbi:MAG: hypothetical protein R2881_07150 [Eubacteriales bacterium]
MSVPRLPQADFSRADRALDHNRHSKKDALLSCTSLTGYSGGGHKMISQYESDYRDVLIKSAPHTLGRHAGTSRRCSTTAVSHRSRVFSRGGYFNMLTIISVFHEQLADSYDVNDIQDLYRARYTGPMVRYCEAMDERGYLASGKLKGLDWHGHLRRRKRSASRCSPASTTSAKGASGAADSFPPDILADADPYSGLTLGK